MKELKCRKCHTLLTEDNYNFSSAKIYNYICKKCYRAKLEEYRKDPENRKRQATLVRKWKNKNRYGMVVGQFEDMYNKQEGKCLICGSFLIIDGSPSKRPNVDHDHKTGKVRGLLCRRCNQGIGVFEDDSSLLFNASKYLLNNLPL